MVSVNNRPAAGRDVLVTHISTISSAAMVSLGCSVYGLISGMMESYTLLKASAPGPLPKLTFDDHLPNLPFDVVLKDMLFLGGLRFVGWLVVGFVAGGVLASFFNILARTTGGLRIRIRDGEHP
jgi:hypothetical protein